MVPRSESEVVNLGALFRGSGSSSVGPVILELPLNKIRRTLMRTKSIDQNKVQDSWI